jgi:hypothetical protein
MTHKPWEDGYFQEARARARRRKSPWNLLLIPFTIVGIGGSWYLMAKIMFSLYEARHPGYAFGHTRTNLGGDLIFVPLLLAAIPLGMMIGNILIWCIPPARRTLDKEAKGVWHASFKRSLRDLALFEAIILPIALALSLLGALGPF